MIKKILKRYAILKRALNSLFCSVAQPNKKDMRYMSTSVK